jgi:hypothetical protein
MVPVIFYLSKRNCEQCIVVEQKGTLSKSDGWSKMIKGAHHSSPTSPSSIHKTQKKNKETLYHNRLIQIFLIQTNHLLLGGE